MLCMRNLTAICCGCRWPSEPEPDYDSEPVNLRHFVFFHTVGRAEFGKVRVVKHLVTSELYALKYIDKTRCVRMRAVAFIIQERRLLEEIHHPFVVNMRYAFQDETTCFLVLDLMLGGTLRFQLEHHGPFHESVVCFWVAELSCALKYLRAQKIVHRDLKPDNILLDAAGHAHITGFSIAIHYSDRRLMTSVSGSMAYMAPQVLERNGYSWQIDWWSLGVMAYELIFNKRPFSGQTSAQLTRAILEDPLKFPEDARSICSDACIGVLQGLLHRNPAKRLSCRQDGYDIQQHPWFVSTGWGDLETKAAQPPFVPDTKSANFDASYELEELLEKPKHPRPNFSAGVELRQLEDLFVSLALVSALVPTSAIRFNIYDFVKSERTPYYPQSDDNPRASAISIGRIYRISAGRASGTSSTWMSAFSAGGSDSEGDSRADYISPPSSPRNDLNVPSYDLRSHQLLLKDLVWFNFWLCFHI
ncbi:kinase-like domain-containing protein [Mycena sp. CBHHK59/15]|nr:kinase-like domain-containing protein [Mycena sp. CBHHK59/15]